jgi:hypothetical protein
MSTNLAARDDRLLLALLEQIAQLGSPKAKDQFGVEGYCNDQVSRHLAILRDTGRINYIEAGDGDDPDYFFAKSPTAAGWNWMAEAGPPLRAPVRTWWRAIDWKWVIGTLIAAAGLLVAALALW